MAKERICALSFGSSPQRESTAEDGVKQVVLSQLLDVLWSEVAPILQPLLIAARDRAMKGMHFVCTYLYLESKAETGYL